MDLRGKVLSGLGWSAGTKLLGQSLSWAASVIVIRLLEPGDYGLMAIAGVFILFLATLSEFGLGAALIQRQKLDETILRQVFGLLIVINFCLFLLLFSVAPLIARFFEEHRISLIIRVLSIQFLVMSFGTIPRSLIIRKMDFKKLSIVDVISTIMGSLATLILAMMGWGVWSLVCGNLAISLCSTAILNFISPNPRVPRFSFNEMRQTISFGGYVTLNGIMWFFLSQADMFIIGKSVGKELLGFYSMAKNVALLPIEKATGVIGQVAFPAFSSIQNDLQKSGAHFLKAVRIVSFFAFPVLWGVSSIAPELVGVLFGNKWYLASLPLQILSLVVPFRMIRDLLIPTMNGLGRPDLSFFNSFFAAMVIPLAILIGIHWGLVGVSIAWVFAFLLVFLCNLLYVVRVLKITVSNILVAMMKPVLGAATMYAGIMTIKMVFGTNAKSVWHLILLIVAGTIIYSTAIMTMHMDGCREVLRLMKDVRGSSDRLLMRPVL